MSGFTGKTVTEDAIPSDIAPLRGDFAKFLQERLGSGAAGLGLDLNPDMSAYEQLFRQRNAQNFAQARESAGTLTGSGLENSLGRAAGQASVEQSAFLANLLENSRQQNANRMASYFSPFLNTGVGPPQMSYQPGFLDYAMQGGAIAAGAFGGR